MTTSNRVSQFAEIFDAVRTIPEGKVASYGQIASFVGATARTVGWAVSSPPEDVPWHRVVGADGTLRIGKRSPILMKLQRELLEAEGVSFLENGCVDMLLHRTTNI
jgi:methylated-DNA-protein-cysteine methyltransferase-like protein